MEATIKFIDFEIDGVLYWTDGTNWFYKDDQGETLMVIDIKMYRYLQRLPSRMIVEE